MHGKWVALQQNHHMQPYFKLWKSFEEMWKLTETFFWFYLSKFWNSVFSGQFLPCTYVVTLHLQVVLENLVHKYEHMIQNQSDHSKLFLDPKWKV